MWLNEVMYHLICNLLYIGCTLYPLNHMSVGLRFLELSPNYHAYFATFRTRLKFTIRNILIDCGSSSIHSNLLIVRLGLDPFQVEVNPVIFCKQNTCLHFIIKKEKDEALINPHKPTLCQTAFLFTKNTYYIVSQ